MSGRVLGFGGRILGNDKKAAKYLNSPESDIYHKSKVLYGIYEAKQWIAKENNCFLVEGYTDVIQFHQRGIKNVVASSGTALTPEQIRLVNRLTPNITVLFDGDPAGLRASLRGIDLILEQGMNVKVCSFPEGQDPDSFARDNSLEELTLFLEENSKDFIAFKASLLAVETQNDPIRKAETIRDIVISISKIPDVIKQEVYIKECSRIMDISEEVLFNTLAQILEKDRRDASKKPRQQQKQPISKVTTEVSAVEKVNVQHELERKIIELLLLYGTKEEEFEDLILETTEDGDITFTPDKVESRVYEKIYLDLQDDEVEFTNDDFRELYYEIISRYNREQHIQVESLVNDLPPEKAEKVSDILMDEERYQLHDWERKDIYVRDKEYAISQVVSETILNLRRELVNKKIEELSQSLKDTPSDEEDTRMHDIVDYVSLKKILSEKLRRVL